jgi:hypothetical protein
MCRSAAHGGRRCTGHGYSHSRANQAARQRLSRTTRALAAAEAAGDTDAAGAARQRVADARDAVEATRMPATACTPKPRSMVPDGDPVAVKPLGGKSSGAKLLTYADGTRLVHKDTAVIGENASGYDPVAVADAEELGSTVLAALGLPTAKVERTGETELHIEYIEGVTGGTFTSADGSVGERLLEKNQGRVIGLADHVMSNHDRHGGNWMWTGDDNVIGIDHGNAFHDEQPVTGSAFARPLYEQDPVSGESKMAAHNDFTPADMDDAHERLDSVRPDFERVGRTDWHDAMVRRLDDVAQHATGTRNRLAPKAPDASAAHSPTSEQEFTVDRNAWPASDGDSPEQRGDVTPGNGPVVNNYAAPGATVGMQTGVSHGDVVVMNLGQQPVVNPAGFADHAARIRAQMDAAFAGGSYTVHHSDDATSDAPAGPGQTVAFQVSKPRRRNS